MNKLFIFLLAFICSFVCIHAAEQDEITQLFHSCSQPEKITHISVSPFVENEISLEEGYISLRHGTEVTDQALKEMGKLFPALQILMVGGSKITDEGLVELAAGCPDLRLLSVDPRYVSWNENLSDEMLKGQLTDRAVVQLAVSCPQLQSVNLNGHQISDASVEALARICPELYSLSVSCYEPGQLTDKSLLSLAENNKKLETVDVSVNPGITVAGVKALLASGNPLRAVGICRTSISKEEYEELRSSHPDVNFFWGI